MWWHDWEQFKKNLQVERTAWEKYESRLKLLEEELASQIEHAREEMERKKLELEEEFKNFKKRKMEEFKRKKKWLKAQYLREVERKTRPTVSL